MTNTFSMELLCRRLLSADRELNEDNPPDAAVAVIINSFQRGGSLLLIRRTERSGDPWSGQIAFPGGHRASVDRSFLDTAIRETNEEVGISLREHIVLGVLPLTCARTREIRVAPFVFQLKTNVELHPNMEVANAFWVPVNSLAHCPVTRRKVRVPEGEITVDSYIYGENVIWGLTFRIVNMLLGKA